MAINLRNFLGNISSSGSKLATGIDPISPAVQDLGLGQKTLADTDAEIEKAKLKKKALGDVGSRPFGSAAASSLLGAAF